MKEGKQDRKTRYTRMVLEDSLIELMGQKPITKITIKELCENADINRTTFYAHFTDQYDLLHTIEDETLSWANEMLMILLESDKKDSIKIIERIFDYIVENSHHIQVLMSEQGDADFQKKLLSLIYEYCGKTYSYPDKFRQKPDEFYFIFAVSGSIGLIQHWLKTGLQKSAKEMAEIIDNMVLSSDYMNI